MSILVLIDRLSYEYHKFIGWQSCFYFLNFSTSKLNYIDFDD